MTHVHVVVERNIRIAVEGNRMLQVTSFETSNISSEIRKALNVLGYKQPTPVQSLVLTQGIAEYDLCVKAKTGSGKTAAYGIPICNCVDWKINAPQALVIVPTRELAVQIGEELALIGKFKRIHVATIFGKMSISEQELTLKQKTHIVVGTPGRILDLIQRESLKTDQLKTIVVDEADEMFFIGLRAQVEAILESIHTLHRTLLFSATLSEEIVELASSHMNKIKTLEVMEEESEEMEIVQSAILTTEFEKAKLLDYILLEKNPDSCMIFANTQETVDRICNKMKEKGYPCKKLHGGLKQKDRLRVMEQFKRKQFRYLVVTDVAARGIDIKEISLVINYDLAKGPENYTHRIGRTGRNKASGEAITFYTEKETSRMREIESAMAQDISRIKPDFSKDFSKQKEELQKKLQTKPKEEAKKGAAIKSEVMKLHINAGKKSKIRTCEIVASICGIDGVVADDIGVIQITETATFVEILNKKGSLVLKELPKKTIKGRNRKVHRAKE